MPVCRDRSRKLYVECLLPRDEARAGIGRESSPANVSYRYFLSDSWLMPRRDSSQTTGVCLLPDAESLPPHGAHTPQANLSQANEVHICGAVRSEIQLPHRIQDGPLFKDRYKSKLVDHQTSTHCICHAIFIVTPPLDAKRPLAPYGGDAIPGRAYGGLSATRQAAPALVGHQPSCLVSMDPVTPVSLSSLRLTKTFVDANQVDADYLLEWNGCVEHHRVSEIMPDDRTISLRSSTDTD